MTTQELEKNLNSRPDIQDENLGTRDFGLRSFHVKKKFIASPRPTEKLLKDLQEPGEEQEPEENEDSPPEWEY